MKDFRPDALVVFASEQPWPNIHSQVHWGPHLRHLFICRSENADKSGLPAERLRNLCQRQYNQIEVHGVDEPVGSSRKASDSACVAGVSSFLAGAGSTMRPVG